MENSKIYATARTAKGEAAKLTKKTGNKYIVTPAGEQGELFEVCLESDVCGTPAPATPKVETVKEVVYVDGFRVDTDGNLWCG